MVTFIAQKPSFSSIPNDVIWENNFCKTPSDFGQISDRVWQPAGGLNFGQGPGRSLAA